MSSRERVAFFVDGRHFRWFFAADEDRRQNNRRHGAGQNPLGPHLSALERPAFVEMNPNMRMRFQNAKAKFQ